MQVKNRYELRLGDGVGSINLGMNRQEIISILGDPEYSRQGRLSDTDCYTSKGLNIDYSSSTDLCEGIEVFDSELIYQEVDILALTWDDLYTWMLENDPGLYKRIKTFISPNGRIAAGPKIDDDTGTEMVESIVVFSEAYWPSEEETAAAAEEYVQSVPSAKETAKKLGLENFF
jgi:hypothetical protein